MAIRLVLAEDHYLVREGLRRLLETRPELEVATACADLESLLAAVDAERPDVVVTDIRMPPTGTDEGIQAARAIRGSHPEAGVVVLSQYADPAYALALFEDGSDRRSYLLKDRVADVAEFADALARVAAGGTALDPEVVSQLLSASRQTAVVASLTPREREVLTLMAEGRSNAGIGAALVLSTGAVEKHVANICAKLGLPQTEGDNRRVLAVLRYLDSPAG